MATYGEPPRAADWNPSSAKWSGQQWRVERYRAGRADGSAWPALNSAKRPFGGSLNAALQAAGHEPARPGPTRRTSVDPAQADRAMISPEGRAMIEAALAQAREAEKRVAVLEARLARARSKNDNKKEHGKNKHKVKTRVVRERVVDDAAVARAERRAAAAEVKAATAATRAKEAIDDAKVDAAEARVAAKRLSSRLERAEATIAALREERQALKADVRGGVERLRMVERSLDSARAEARAARSEADAAHALRAVAAAEPVSADAAAVRAAQAEAAAARGAARKAETRASTAERELLETVAALNGEARRLTPDELASLRADGPSGPAVLAAALKSLARARARDGSPTVLQSALLDVASAAITWRERI
ncbi:MAG TPA: hypothetical protein VI318_26495 [Baekduia sp.]